MFSFHTAVHFFIITEMQNNKSQHELNHTTFIHNANPTSHLICICFHLEVMII